VRVVAMVEVMSECGRGENRGGSLAGGEREKSMSFIGEKVL
jgi:hypothetical protein